jgi:hypothetical protein
MQIEFCALALKPQLCCAEQLAERHSFAEGAQSLGCAQATHSPALHTALSPLHAGSAIQLPAVHRLGTAPSHFFSPSMHETHLPAPSHFPPAPGAPQGVSFAIGCVAQVPSFPQSASAHSFAEAAQSSLFVQPTQWSPKSLLAQNGVAASQALFSTFCPSAEQAAMLLPSTQVPLPGLHTSHCPPIASHRPFTGHVTTLA